MPVATINDSKCVLVLGATAGIGRALARRIAALPSKPTVIAVGRRQERLDELAQEGFKTIRFDVDTDEASLKAFVEETTSKYPQLDAVIFSTGVEYESNPAAGLDLQRVRQELNVNYISVVTIVNYLTPHFLKLADAGRPCLYTIITSGLSIQPAAWMANYSATKAALHSFCMSLRLLLEDRNVHVYEIIPPLVESELHRNLPNADTLSAFWIPLEKYADETIIGLRAGEQVITTTNSKIAYERHEVGKIDVSRIMLKQWTPKA